MEQQYEITIKETLEKIVTVYANSEEEAEKKAVQDYEDGKIVLTADDFVPETTFGVRRAQ